jgi:hypothetical protein
MRNFSLPRYASLSDLALPVLPILIGIAVRPTMTGGGVVVCYAVSLSVLWMDRRAREITMGSAETEIARPILADAPECSAKRIS